MPIQLRRSIDTVEFEKGHGRPAREDARATEPDSGLLLRTDGAERYPLRLLE